MLLAFFGYFGRPDHLSPSTRLQVGGVEVSFEATRLATVCQQLFFVSFVQLTKAAADPGLILRLAGKRVVKRQAVSSSRLGLLLDAGKLQAARTRALQLCSDCAPFDPEARSRIASEVLQELNGRMFPKTPVRLEDLARDRPDVLCRLRSFDSAAEALRWQSDHKKAHQRPQTHRSADGPVQSSRPRFTRGGVIGSQLLPRQSGKKRRRSPEDLVTDGPGQRRDGRAQDSFQTVLRQIREKNIRERVMRETLLSRKVSRGSRGR
jgi:hypothetical protein